ncbi:MAG: relaxase/mobilization nuclease domain-containing protein [Chitinophagaceae bacterium]
MVVHLHTGKSLGRILAYNENKVLQGKAELILAGNFCAEAMALTQAGKKNRFQRWISKNPRSKKPAIHIFLSFPPGECRPVDQLQLLAIAFLDRVGLGTQPFLVYQHLDAAHPHLHLVTCCIHYSGRWIDTYRSCFLERQRIKMEMEQLFVPAPLAAKPEGPIIPIVYGRNSTAAEIGRVIASILSTFQVSSFQEFNAILYGYHLMADRGKEGNPMFQHRGLLFRVMDYQGKKVGPPYPASHLPGQPVLDRLEQLFRLHSTQDMVRKTQAMQRIQRILEDHPSLTPLELIPLLLNRKISGVCIPELFWVDQELKSVGTCCQWGLPFGEKEWTQALREHQAIQGLDPPNFSSVPSFKHFPERFLAGQEPEKSPGMPEKIQELTRKEELSLIHSHQNTLLPPTADGGKDLPRAKKRSRTPDRFFKQTLFMIPSSINMG